MTQYVPRLPLPHRRLHVTFSWIAINGLSRYSPASCFKCTVLPENVRVALAMVPVPHAYDVVLTTNSGYPLDQNLYQSVKGLAAAEPIVRDGGTIILAAECSDGLPEDGSYAAHTR